MYCNGRRTRIIRGDVAIAKLVGNNVVVTIVRPLNKTPLTFGPGQHRAVCIPAGLICDQDDVYTEITRPIMMMAEALGIDVAFFSDCVPGHRPTDRQAVKGLFC